MIIRPDTDLINHHSDAKAGSKKAEAYEGRGFLNKYANPELIRQEKEAGRMHVARMRKKYTPRE